MNPRRFCYGTRSVPTTFLCSTNAKCPRDLGSRRHSPVVCKRPWTVICGDPWSRRPQRCTAAVESGGDRVVVTRSVVVRRRVVTVAHKAEAVPNLRCRTATGRNRREKRHLQRFFGSGGRRPSSIGPAI